MDFNITGYLIKNGYEYKEDDLNYQLKECPSCANQNWKFGISKTKKYVSHCFVCGVSLNLYQLIMLIDDVSFFDAKKIVENKTKKSMNYIMKKYNWKKETKKIFDYSKIESVKFPDEFKKLKEHIPYTKKRGLDLSIVEKFNLHFASEGYWKNRLIIPVTYNGITVGWQGRDVTGKADIKIKSTKGFSKSKFILNYDDIKNKKIGILCEGPFDVMHAATADERIGAFGILGKELSEDQLNLLLHTKLKTIYIGLDPDFPENIINTARKLNQFFNVKILPIEEDKDLGDMSTLQIKRSIIYAKPVPSRFLMEK